MLEIFLVRDDGNLVRGGTELIEEWKSSIHAKIWVDMQGLSTVEEDQIVRVFGLHHLVITDARRMRHPPKLEVFDDHFFILLRGLDADSNDLDFGTIQLALFAGERFLVTRHDNKSVSVSHWAATAQLASVLNDSGIRLAMEISTTVARRYLELLLNFEPRLTELEDLLEARPDDSTMRELTGYRTRLRKMRRDFSYHAGLFQALRETEAAYFHGHKGKYKHTVIDVFEKYERLLTLCTLYYEQAGDLVDGYISLTSHALNNTMRILTVLTAIFVPLGFLAGLYGMNFDFMPELHYKWSYFILLGTMATIIVSLLAVFRYKRWL